MPNSKSSYDKIVEQNNSGLSPLVIFDLDSTLFELRFRSKKIIEDISNLPEMRGQWPEECGALADVETLPQDWGVRDALIRSRIRAPLEFFEAVRNQWKERFFSNEYLSEDQPYDGAVEYVNAIKEAGADIIYLTGRSQQRMALGTQESLKQWGFPYSEEEGAGRLYLKPSLDIKDSDFKSEFIKKIEHPQKQIWFFENEAFIIELVEKSTPDINIIFLDTVHSGRAESPSHLPKINGRFQF